VVIELLKTKGNTRESSKHYLWMERCYFHEHEAGEPRCDDGHEEVRDMCIRYEDSGTDISDAETMEEGEAKQWRQECEQRHQEHDRFIQDLNQRHQELERLKEERQQEIRREPEQWRRECEQRQQEHTQRQQDFKTTAAGGRPVLYKTSNSGKRRNDSRRSGSSSSRKSTV